MSGNDGHKAEHGRQYVDRVLEDTQRYAHDVLAENERLQRLVASLEHERAQLAERNGILQGIERENQALQDLLASIEREKQRLQQQLGALREDGEQRARDQSRLREELSTIAERSQGFSQQLLQIERQNSNLANLYVATYQLHGSVERDVVLATIQEILANLVGTEQVAIFELADGGPAPGGPLGQRRRPQPFPGHRPRAGTDRARRGHGRAVRGRARRAQRRRKSPT